MGDLARPANQLASVGVPLGELPRPEPEGQIWPVGMGGIWWWALGDLPDNFRRLDGQTLSADEFPDLARLAGVASGGTITLPNMNGLFPLGVGPGDDFDEVRETGGSFTIGEASMPEHAHSISSDGLHGHTLATGGQVYTQANPTLGVTLGPTIVFGLTGINNAPNHTHGGATGNAGSGTPFRQPFMAVYFVVRVK